VRPQRGGEGCGAAGEDAGVPAVGRFASPFSASLPPCPPPQLLLEQPAEHRGEGLCVPQHTQDAESSSAAESASRAAAPRHPGC
jgi:hypothetical protein